MKGDLAMSDSGRERRLQISRIQDAELFFLSRGMTPEIDKFFGLPVVRAMLSNAFATCNSKLTTIAEHEVDAMLNSTARNLIFKHRVMENEFKNALKVRFKLYIANKSVAATDPSKEERNAQWWISEMQKADEGYAYNAFKELTNKFVENVCKEFPKIVAYEYINQMVAPRLLTTIYGKESNVKVTVKEFSMSTDFGTCKFEATSLEELYT